MNGFLAGIMVVIVIFQLYGIGRAIANAGKPREPWAEGGVLAGGVVIALFLTAIMALAAWVLFTGVN